MNQARKKADEQALKDLREATGEYHFGVLVGMAAMARTVANVNALNVGLDMAGVEPTQFHAFCRRYCLNAYKQWINDGRAVSVVDDNGYPVR